MIEHYWVLLEGEWVVAQKFTSPNHPNGIWFLPGDYKYHSKQTDFERIGPKVEPPSNPPSSDLPL